MNRREQLIQVDKNELDEYILQSGYLWYLKPEDKIIIDFENYIDAYHNKIKNN